MVRQFYLFSFIVLLPFYVKAQRNLINVSTSEIVERNHLFFQEQASVSNREIKSGTTFTWGLGKDVELGFNIYQLSFNTHRNSRIIIINPEQPEKNPDLLINAQKGFKLQEWATLGLGTRSGINVVRSTDDLRFLNFTYINSKFSISGTENKLIVGGYYANTPYAGQGTRGGLMMGIEAIILKDKLGIIADYLSGTSSLSVINLGLQVSLFKQWQIAFAAQFPSPGSQNNCGGVIQISRK